MCTRRCRCGKNSFEFDFLPTDKVVRYKTGPDLKPFYKWVMNPKLGKQKRQVKAVNHIAQK